MQYIGWQIIILGSNKGKTFTKKIRWTLYYFKTNHLSGMAIAGTRIYIYNPLMIERNYK